MKYIILIGLMVISISSCRTYGNIPVKGQAGSENSLNQKGSSFQEAVIIQKFNETEGVSEEYRWIAIHHPGYATVRQALTYHMKKPYDIITIRNDKGEEMQIYFDISNFFGKL